MTNEDFIKGILCEVDTYDYKRWRCRFCFPIVIIVDQCRSLNQKNTEEDATQATGSDQLGACRCGFCQPELPAAATMDGACCGLHHTRSTAPSA